MASAMAAPRMESPAEAVFAAMSPQTEGGWGMLLYGKMLYFPFGSDKK
jgi:hypothetical protein